MGTFIPKIAVAAILSFGVSSVHAQGQGADGGSLSGAVSSGGGTQSGAEADSGATSPDQNNRPQGNAGERGGSKVEGAGVTASEKQARDELKEGTPDNEKQEGRSKFH